MVGTSCGIYWCRRAAELERAAAAGEPHGRAMAVNRDQRRALRLLAAAPNGATEAIVLAHGFTISLLDDLVLRGLATAEKRAMRARRWPMLMITDAGRQAVDQ
jgi:hypothetical protein